ncbi:Sentrin-specific protease 7 [Chionoecetes opilio]|uniref:Sentrin-specific protease 7 n=1 Tax=Chionoecetes opilio TaxID=41210 RepID=A0A8J8WNK9_CHIOP|nr:Sentrin-specific protease 7 [Chionoecetes opilio]
MRQALIGIQQQLPQQQQQQPQQKQQQQEEQQQPSYQDQYLKQLQNKIDTQQKSANRSKVGAQVNQSALSGTSIPSTPASAKQQQENQHQQPVKQVTLQAVQAVTPTKKLSLNQYRQRISHDLKQQTVQKLITTAQGEEVRIPVSINKQQNQQYYYVERADGTKVLAVLPMDQSATTTVALTHPMANMTSSTSGRNTSFAASASDSNTVITMKHQDSPAQSSSSAATTLNSPITLSSSRNISSNTVSSSNSSSASPPLQEHVVHSSVPGEQTEKNTGDKPRFIPGQVSLCTNCGILSEDLVKCQRCNHKLPMQPRPEPPVTTTTTITAGCKAATCDSMTMTAKGISVTQFSKQEFYGKTGGGTRRPEKKTASPANNKSKAKGRAKGKAPEEPVILTLSSDEDEEKPGGSGGLCGSGVAGSPQAGGHLLGPPEPVNHKEPIITADMEDLEDSEKEGNIGAVIGGGMPDLQSLNDGTLKGPYTSLQCRSLRIGSYKVTPKERVLIVPQGLRIEVPPIAEDESQKRITILPDRLTEENKNLVKEVFGPCNTQGNSGAATSTSTPSDHVNVLEELDHKEANEILLRASSAKIQNLVKKSATTPAIPETKLLLIYPPPPQKGGISISSDDYCCLEEEQFLNDVILDFYLKWLLQSKLSEIHRQHTHVFSTFFYKRLTSKPKKRRINAPEDDPKLSAAEKRHARVRSWTKTVDIFSKDFIIIPINEHAHWFLAIICFPGLNGPVRIADGLPVPVLSLDKPKKRKNTRPRNRVEIPIIDDGEWSDRDEAEGEEDELEEDDEEEEESQASKKSKVAPGIEGETEVAKPDSSPPPSIRQPCILIFDSLTGANRARIVATLRDYLTVEHKVRKGAEKLFTRDTMKGACPRVPQQMNYSDCGVYTLQFAESFFEDPIKDYTFPIRSLCEWFPQEVVRGKREAVAKLIANLMEQHNPNHGSITLPDIYFTSDKKEKDGTNMAPIATASEPQEGCSASTTTLTKTVLSVTPTVAGQDISKTPANSGSESDAKMPNSANSFNVNEVQSMNQLKTVEASNQKMIIDEDTSEVLLIMNPTSPTLARPKMEAEALPARRQSIIFDEEKNYVNTGETTEVIKSKTVATQPVSKSLATLQQERSGRSSSPIRRVGIDHTPHTVALPSGSSSPSQTGSGTPAVFRFSERGVSSGRTIAPPKRYLEDDEIFPKKRRDKSAQGKSRNVVR